MTALIASLVLGVLGALFTALAGGSAFVGRSREVGEGLYSLPSGDNRTLGFTLAASGCTALAVIVSTAASLVSAGFA